MDTIVNKSSGDVSVAAHAIKSLLEIKFSRAGQRHASAMGFKSANHLLDAIKSHPVEQEFDQYIRILKTELIANHQLMVSDELTERLRKELVSK